MRFLDNFLFKQIFDKRMMITEITCSMLESPSTSNDDDMRTGASKSTRSESTRKNLIKEKYLAAGQHKIW